MFGFGKPRNPEEHRYYLLPGQGRGVKRKRQKQLLAALLVGAVFSCLLGAVLWWMNQLH